MGDGPIDASFKAIDKIVNPEAHTFKTYTIQSISEGKDTLGDVTVRLAAGGRTFTGKGLSTDIIAGYCGESEEDHQETLSLMRHCSYDAAFMFKYSERPGTFASRHFKDDIEDSEKVRRLNEIIALQQECSANNNRKCIGETYEVLIEGVSKRSKEQFYGRSEQNRTAVFDRK